MRKLLKKIGLLFLVAVVGAVPVFGAATSPIAVSDLDYIRGALFNEGSYTYHSISVGERISSSVMRQGGPSAPNTDVYILTVAEPMMVNLDAVPYTKQYYTNLQISGPWFVDDRGAKQYRFIEALSIEDYKGYGNAHKSAYLDAGTYYFEITGYAYTSEEQVANYLTPVGYQLDVTGQAYLDETDQDTTESAPYFLNAAGESVSGQVGMNRYAASADGDYRLDTKDRLIIPAGVSRTIALEIENMSSNPLNQFKKEIVYTRNNEDKTALELRTLSENYTNQAAISVSVQSNGSYKILPGVVEKLNFKAEAGVDYNIDIMSALPSVYTVRYTATDAAANIPEPTTEPTTPEPTTPEPTTPEPTTPEPTTPEPTTPETENPEVNPDETSTAYDIYGCPAVRMPAYDGRIEREAYTLLYGGAFTNNRVTDGRRDGNGLKTIEKFDVKNKRIYGAFTVYGDTYASHIGAGVENVFAGTSVTTGNSYNGSVYVPSGTKVYKIVGLTDSTYYMILTTGNFYGMQGAEILYHENGILSDASKAALNTPQSIYFSFGDNYGGAENKMAIHYMSIEPYVDHISELIHENAADDMDVSEPDVDINTIEGIEPTLETASEWARNNLDAAIRAGFDTPSVTQVNFRDDITREAFCELAVSLYEKLGGPEVSTVNPFVDTVNPSVVKAYHAGIVGGIGNQQFGPDALLTREQLCVMIANALTAAGVSLSETQRFQKTYDDINEISSWAETQVRTMNGYGIMNGNLTSLNPKETVTNEMALLMVYNAYQAFR